MLVVVEVAQPREVQAPVERAAEDRSHRHRRDAEERMERHHREQQAQAADERQTLRPGVDADDAPEEQVSGDQEVQAHELVTPVVAHECVEQWGEVHGIQ